MLLKFATAFHLPLSREISRLNTFPVHSVRPVKLASPCLPVDCPHLTFLPPSLIRVHVINVFTHAGIASGVASAFIRVCLSICPCSNRKMTWAVNTKLGTRILYSICSACIDPEPERSKGQSHTATKTVMVARLLVTVSRILHTNTPLCYLRPLQAWVCISIRLPMFSSCCIVWISLMSGSAD